MPEEILTDNGKQFTDRFGKGGEVLFDKICRKNGITHRLTAPASPTTTGKVERFHLTLRRELLSEHDWFTSVEAAQAAIDAWVSEYNADRPHQALDGRLPVTPADRFTPVAARPAGAHRPVAATCPHPRQQHRGPHSHRPADTAAAPAAGSAARWSSTGWCRRQGTCGWPGGSSGSAPPGPER